MKSIAKSAFGLGFFLSAGICAYGSENGSLYCETQFGPQTALVTASQDQITLSLDEINGLNSQGVIAALAEGSSEINKYVADRSHAYHLLFTMVPSWDTECHFARYANGGNNLLCRGLVTVTIADLSDTRPSASYQVAIDQLSVSSFPHLGQVFVKFNNSNSGSEKFWQAARNACEFFLTQHF